MATGKDDYAFAADDEYDEDGQDLGVRLTEGIDLADLRSGEGIEINIDEDGLKQDNIPDESSSYYEGADIYKQSELHNLGEDSDEESDYETAEFDKLRSKMVALTEDGGVMKRILRDGFGPTISEYVEEKQKVEAEMPEGRELTSVDINLAYHYTGLLEDALEPFDNTYLRSIKPQRTHLADQLEGVKIALASMREKEIADFLISPKYAFGIMGCPPRIPREATLRYKFELCTFWLTTELESYLMRTRDEKRNFSVGKLVKMCSAQREEGNKLYAAGNFRDADFNYGRAIRVLEEANLQNDEDERLQQRGLMKLYLNRAQTSIHLKKWNCVITFSDKALYIEPRNSKALYRKAKGKMEYGDYYDAKTLAQKAHNIDPSNASIGRLLEEISSRERADKQAEQLMCQKMLKMTTMKAKPKPTISTQMREMLYPVIQKFIDSEVPEMKLDGITYTKEELEAISILAVEAGVGVKPNIEDGDGDWISLRLVAQSSK